MRGMVLVVISMAEPYIRYPSPISGKAEHHSLHTYETMKLGRPDQAVWSAVHVSVGSQERKGVLC